MGNVLDFILLFLSQFAGGPGPVENNLARFGLPAILWGMLLYIAWTRQRTQDLPREKLLVWGFGPALLSDLYKFSLMSYCLLGGGDAEVKCDIFQPLEQGLAMAAMIIAAGAFLLVNQLGIFILQMAQIVFRTPISISFALHQGSQSAFTRART